MSLYEQLTLTGDAEPASVRRSAVLSPCGLYRYRLEREWADPDRDVRDRPPLVYVMLNPSTADGERDDATIRVCCSRARRIGAGGIVVVNLFARRATDPRVLAHVFDLGGDAVGPDNDTHVLLAVSAATRVVCAWGACDLHQAIRERAAAVRRQLLDAGAPLYHLGLTASGEPRHPLRVPLGRELEPLR